MLKVTHTQHKKGWSRKKWDIPMYLPLAMEAHKVSTANEGLVPQTQLCGVKTKINFKSVLMALAKEDKLGMSMNQVVFGSYHAHLQNQASFWAAEYGGGGSARSLSVPCRDGRGSEASRGLPAREWTRDEAAEERLRFVAIWRKALVARSIELCCSTCVLGTSSSCWQHMKQVSVLSSMAVTKPGSSRESRKSASKSLRGRWPMSGGL